MEKLRKRLEKEEKRIAKAEATTSKEKVELITEVSKTDISALGNEIKKRKRSDSGASGNAKIEDTNLIKPQLQEAAGIVPDPLTPTSQPALADEERDTPPKALNAADTDGQEYSSTRHEGDGPSLPEVYRSIQDSSVSMSDLSSDTTSIKSEDSTSSSGSSSDDAPDEAFTKRNRPERVAPLKRAEPKQICRDFLHNGLCKRGTRCKFLHELPERGRRGTGAQEVKRAEGKKERVGLYQRVSHQAQRKILANNGPADNVLV